MRLNYFKLGSVLRVDELNALLTILINEPEDIYETIRLSEEGFDGNLATYTLSHSDGIVYRDTDFVVTDNTDYLEVTCKTDLNCVFHLFVDGVEYISDTENKIIIDLGTYNINETVDNEFIVKVSYEMPYIASIGGTDGVINLTSELRDAILVSNDGDTILVSDNITNDLTAPIEINQKITIKPINSSSTITGTTNLDMRLFNITDDGELNLVNILLKNWQNDDDGGCIFNEGKLSLLNCTFSNCSSDSFGGAVYSTGTLFSEKTSFNNCSATYGGAIMNKKME